ncbi:MAG: NAD-dependent deacylase [Myxococcales bacterium]|nr:NAD-dependent deacylase [Myxococcales bacterium]
MDDSLDALARAFESAQSALFITGAGISADSGLPTYRGVSGLYEDVDPEDGLPIEELLSGPMFQAQPALTWKYIRQIEEACRGAAPNVAHRAIAALERRLERVWVLTQNVDGLHVAAGSRNVIAIHGDVHQLVCTACDYQARVPDFAALAPLPRCPTCAAVIRPAVVLFGEWLPGPAVAAMERELRRGFDIVLSIGTSSPFPYIIRPVIEARARGAVTVEINPGETVVSDLVDHRLRTGAVDAFTRLMARLGVDAGALKP